MSRDIPKAPTVGHCTCPNPHCGKLAAIRRNKSGKHYAVCQTCGPIYWLTPAGQEFFLNEGTMWGAAGAPDDLPEWIRDGKVAPRERTVDLAEKKVSAVPVLNRAPAAPHIVPSLSAESAPQPKSAPAPKPASASKSEPRPWWQF